MDILKYLALYFSAAATFFVLDMLWLGLIAKNLYRENLKPLLAEDFNRLAAFGFYAVFIVGILIFAVMPALKDGNFSRAILFGALFGFFTYATYDLTNLATLKNWPLNLTFIDIAWGTFLTAAVASVAFYAGRFLHLN